MNTTKGMEMVLERDGSQRPHHWRVHGVFPRKLTEESIYDWKGGKYAESRKKYKNNGELQKNIGGKGWPNKCMDKHLNKSICEHH